MNKLLMLAALLGTGAAFAKPNVVVSFQPYYTVVSDIAGNRANVSVILKPGASPHTFDPTPRDVRTIASANVAFLNGAGIDEWLAELVKSSGSRARTVEFAERLKYTPLEFMDHDEHAGEEHGHDHGGHDPHIWLDASIMAKAALLIGDELAKADPANAAFYRANAKKENAKLLALHAELKKALAPIRNQSIVTFHGAWTYWSAAYGPKIAAAVEPFPGKEPSARYVRDVVNTLRKQQVKAVFAEPTLPEAPARTIAESAGARLGILTPEGSAKVKDYYTLMRANKDELLRLLK